MGKLTHRVVRGSDLIQRPRWIQTLEQSQLGTIFHDPRWLRTIEQSFGHEAAHIVVEKDGNLVGLLPGFIGKLKGAPFASLQSLTRGSGGPVLTSNWAETLAQIQEGVKSIREKGIVHRIYSDQPEHAQLNDYYQEHGYRTTVNGRLLVDLIREWEEILEDMANSRRRDIRRAREQDYEIVHSRVGDALDNFYERYRAKMNEVGGFPYPKSFFERLDANMREQTGLLTVYIEGRRRGSHLLLYDRYRSRVRYFTTSVLEEDFQHNSGELLHAHAIEEHANGNFSSYDFGGNAVDFRDGIFNYKRQYGGEVWPTLQWEKPIGPLRWKIYTLGRKIYYKLQ